MEDIILERDIYLIITSKRLLHIMQALRCASRLSVFSTVSETVQVLNLLVGFSVMKSEEMEESTASYFKAIC